VVHGADAHAWPEVYLGAALGWVSFEPTPARPVGQLSPEGVVGPAGRTVPPTGPATGPPTSVPTATSTPTTTPPTGSPTSKPSNATPTSGPAGSRGSRSATSAPATTDADGGWPAGAWTALGVALALLLGLLAVVALPVVLTGATLPTTRRRRRRAHEHPSLAVLDAYRTAQRALAPLGLAAPPTDSPVRQAENLVALAVQDGEAGGAGQAGQVGQPPATDATDAPMGVPGVGPTDVGRLASALEDGLLLARALEQVCFASVPATGEQASEAYRRATRLRRARAAGSPPSGSASSSGRTPVRERPRRSNANGRSSRSSSKRPGAASRTTASGPGRRPRSSARPRRNRPISRSASAASTST
jgi:hypothetical protein